MDYSTKKIADEFEKQKNTYLTRSYITMVLIVSFLFLIGIICANAQADEIDMQKIYQIESSNNPNAYNSKSRATGLGQITPIVLTEWNNLNKIKHVSADLYNPEINKKISNWYMNNRIPKMLKYYKHPDNVENRLIAYNAGISYVGKNIPTETKNYIIKYKGVK